MHSDAVTVGQYLAELPDDRHDLIAAVRQIVLDHLPEGYVEGVGWGMLTYTVPMEVSGPTYNGQPLGYVALAAQKRYNSLYLTALYAGSADEAEFRRRWEAGGRRLDMGKSCLRFRTLDDLDVDLLAEVIAGTGVPAFLERYQEVRASTKRGS